jgi:hypothetical protein
VNRESKTGGVPGGVATGLVSSTQQIPIIVKRCVEEVERRGLDIIGEGSCSFMAKRDRLENVIANSSHMTNNTRALF